MLMVSLPIEIAVVKRKRANLGGYLCLQFVDDCTMLAQSRQQMVELFMRYENFCSKLRVLVNWGKCSVTVFKAAPVLSPEQKAEQRALKAAATASLASLPRAQAKASLRAKAQ